jgi:glycosyltransferase involved in cell wall biosynthesis
MKKNKVCFFSTSGKEQIEKEQYSILDIRILHDLGYEVEIASNLRGIPWDCDFYFSWWASGSILPFIISFLRMRPIFVIAGGNEAMLYRDSLTNKPKGYLATPFYKKIATRITLKFCTKTLIVSEFMRNDVTRLGAKSPILVYNSIDTKKFISSGVKRTEITSIFKFDYDVVEIKRGFVLLESIAKVIIEYPDQVFTFIGGKGDVFDKFVEKSIDLQVYNNIRFIDNIPNEEVINWMQRSKMYIQISDTETFGVAIAEAMSCQTPVVVSARGAIPEVVGNLGVYVDHNDPNDVAKGILKILKLNQEEYNELGKQLRRRVQQNFSYEKRKEEIKKIIQNYK